MAVLLAPGSAMEREGQSGKSPVYKDYPKYMRHPGFQPGTVGREVTSPLKVTYNLPGEPIRYPPVLVHTPDQEEYHASQGYVSQGTCSQAAFERLAAGPAPELATYQPQEYPKWNAKLNRVIQSAEEEQRLLGVASDPPGEPAIDTEVATLLDTVHIQQEPVETRAEKLARLKREIEELEGDTPVPVKTKSVLRSEAIKAGLARKRAAAQFEPPPEPTE